MREKKRKMLRKEKSNQKEMVGKRNRKIQSYRQEFYIKNRNYLHVHKAKALHNLYTKTSETLSENVFYLFIANKFYLRDCICQKLIIHI